MLRDSVRDLPPSIPDIDHHSGIQTFYHGCEHFVVYIFPQQQPHPNPPNSVKCICEVDKDNIQRPILLYALFLELSQVKDHVHYALVRTKATRCPLRYCIVRSEKIFFRMNVYTSVNTTSCSVSHFCRWSQCWHPSMPVVLGLPPIF